MRTVTPSDALRLLLLTSLGLTDAGCDSGDSGTGGTSTAGGSQDSGGGEGDTSGDGDREEVVLPTMCTNPRPFVEGEDTGFVFCEEGVVRRVEKKACPSKLPRERELPDLISNSECFSDSDCEGELEFCEAQHWDGEDEGSCYESCLTDVDCNDGQVCLCGEEFGRCTFRNFAAACTIDEDCEAGQACVGLKFDASCGLDFYAFGCTPARVGCLDASLGSAEESDFCIYECYPRYDGVVCNETSDCGRPFLIKGSHSKADSIERDDWVGRPLDDFSGISTRGCGLAAAHYERVALMEHASIAAFARVSLHLLSLGAPAELIELTNQALVDETKHARLAFALASHFGGRAIGPGALDIDSALSDLSPCSVLMTTILEGCVGETMAALEAHAALESCSHEQVRSFLVQVAEDEARHAQLAWSTVKWMLQTRPELRDIAVQAFETALGDRRIPVAPGGSASESRVPETRSALELGVLGPRRLVEVRTRALREVVGPCARALLEGGAHRNQPVINPDGMKATHSLMQHLPEAVS